MRFYIRGFSRCPPSCRCSLIRPIFSMPADFRFQPSRRSHLLKTPRRCTPTTTSPYTPTHTHASRFQWGPEGRVARGRRGPEPPSRSRPGGKAGRATRAQHAPPPTPGRRIPSAIAPPQPHSPNHPWGSEHEGFKHGPGTNRSLGDSGPPGRSRLGAPSRPLELSRPHPLHQTVAHSHPHTRVFSRLPPNISRLPIFFSDCWLQCG